MKKSFIVQILTSLVLAIVLFFDSSALSLSATEGAVSNSFAPFDKALGAILLVLIIGLFSFIIGIFVMHRRVNLIAASSVSAIETTPVPEAQEEVVEEVVQEEVAEEPVQEEVVEEPVQEEVVEEPVQEEVVEEPVQEEVVEEPVQKRKDSFIDINPVESTLEKNDMAELISESISVEEVTDRIDDSIVDSLVIKANDLPKYKKAKKERHIINIDTISEHFNNEEIVDLHSLKEKRLLPQKCNYFKVLARGVLDKKLTVQANDFSRDAVKMILLTGGNVVKIN